MNKLVSKVELYSDILFYAEAWKAEGSLALNLASVCRMVIFHAHKHDTHHCQTHSQGPERKLRQKLVDIISLTLVNQYFRRKYEEDKTEDSANSLYLQSCHSCPVFQIQIQAHLWYFAFFNMQVFQHIFCKQDWSTIVFLSHMT